MKWKTVKTKVKKISGEQEDKAKQSKLVNMQKKSVVQGLLNSGPASRNADTIGLKMDRSCKQEVKCSAESEALHSKDFSSKMSRKISHTEKPQTTKPSEVAVKRRRRTKIEMALSYKARGPDVLGHIVEEVVYDCPANLERRVRDKSSNMSGCMKGKESFWILDDDLIRSMQKKMETLDKKSVQSPQQSIKPKPLVGLKCLSLQRSNVFLNKELDVATIGKTIIQISHAPPARSRIAMNREPSETLMQLENFTETSGFGQTDRLEKLVKSKATGGSVTAIEKNEHNLSPEKESNAKRIHKEVRLITEECATNICHALEEVTSSFQVETQGDELHSSELVKAAQSAARDIEYEVEMDYSGDVDVSDVDVDSLENGWNTAHSEPLSRRNAEGLTRLARLEERNGKLYKKKEMIACPNVTVERISQEHFLLGTRDHFDTIQRTHIPVIHTDISILNSVSLGRSRSTATETMNDEEKEMTTPSAQQEMDGRRLRRRKRKQLFTRRKKCKSASPNASKVKFPSADGCSSWFLQSSITEQVLSGCRLAESGRVAEMEISPEVESAASVLAMMSSGGRIFSGFQRGERRWDSGEPWQKHHPASSTAWTGFQHAGRYMCEVCGQVFMDLALLREHISEHERAELRSAHRKQLRRKQTTKMRVAPASSSSAAPPTQSESSVKSCVSTVDEADKPLLKVQNVECEAQQLCDQPVTTDAQPDVFIGLSQGDDVSQISEADQAAGNMASVTNNKEEVVKLKEGACDEKEIASNDVNPGQDKGILQAVEGELGGIAPPASAESVLGKDTAQDSVNLKQSLYDKTGVDSTPQTNVAFVQAIVGAEDIVEISDSEEEECILVENAKPILIDMKGAVCNSKLVGQKRCKRNASGSTDIRHEMRERELNAANDRSALFGSSCTDPESSSFYPTDEHLTELVEQVVGAMKISGSVFGSEYPSKSKTGAAWATTVCHICNRKFSNSANTRKHIRMTHNSYRPHKCKICGKAFPYPSSLSEHMTSHATNPQKFVCYICGKVFVRQSGLRKHIKEQHETFRPHACNVCDKSFIYRCLLREHQRSHSEERTFKCTECSSVFKQMSNLLMHMKKRHQSTCECPTGNCVCEPKTPRPLPSFSCVICSKVFHDRRQLESHVDSHDGRNPLTCKVCDKVFPNKFVLSKHRMKHQETKVYSCEVCSRSFLSKPALKSHRRTHLGVKPYQCESCGKQYTTKNSLKIHSVRHLEVLPHACDKCNKKFAVQANLTKHMAMHTKEHVFVCCHCDQTFYCNTDLKKHILQHDEQKTYVCPYCSKKFLHQSNLKMHAVKHTGERPHSCGVCGRCFSLKANLRRHMQTHMRKNGHIINESSIPIPGAYVVLGPE